MVMAQVRLVVSFVEILSMTGGVVAHPEGVTAVIVAMMITMTLACCVVGYSGVWVDTLTATLVLRLATVIRLGDEDYSIAEGLLKAMIAGVDGLTTLNIEALIAPIMSN